MITVAIPFYNAENYLEFAIQSVIKQTYKSWELILIDDGSIDNSLNIARKFEKNDSRIRVYSDGFNKNLPYRLNEIATLANTKYLARMDADDIMHSDRLLKQLNILEKHPEIDVLGSNAYSIDDDNKVQGIRIKTNYKTPEIIATNSFIHPTVIAKTDWFRANPYDAKAIRCEDAELWRRTSDHSVFMISTEALLFYREYGSNYYKKYFKSLRGHLYILQKEFKYKNKIGYLFSGFLKTLIVGCIYFLFNIINKENILIRRRYNKNFDSVEIDFT